ncbi:MAG: amidase [Smithella sp.]|nr:amidase [Smithella sp.]
MKKNISKTSPRIKFDPDFGSAVGALKAIGAGVISSKELTKHVFRRIKKHNEKINAFVTLNEEQALKLARRADQTLAKGHVLGPLHGLPVVIKDQFRTAGLRTTCGFRELENYVPRENAVAVQRLVDAGAIIVGKTNSPIGASDIQTYNKVTGTTNNPWDAKKTSGGSTGGGAAALAAGMGFLELGSDLAGSIRTPSNFCGTCGHKSSLNLVPFQGAIPPLPSSIDPGINLEGLNDLAVVGPMARWAEDLKLELSVIAGPAPENAAAYRWSMPKPRKTKLSDYKIGFVTDDPFCPVHPEIKATVASVAKTLRAQGVKVREGWPEGIVFSDIFETYFKLLAAYVSQSPAFTDSVIEMMKLLFYMPFGDTQRRFVEGLTISHKNWVELGLIRLQSRLAWQEYFKTFDAFLMPANCVPAFAHNHERNMWGRIIEASDKLRYYVETFKWISPATLAGLPVTLIPVGMTAQNLPVGIQIMGPYMEDATTLDLAARIEKVSGGFTPPPGYD